MKLIDELYKFFKIKSINSSKDNKDTDNTKEITYYSTDKNSFVTSRIPKNIKIVTKKHNSCTYIDYDITYDKKFIGNIIYASLNIHNGIESSRRDDLISLGYIFILCLNSSKLQIP